MSWLSLPELVHLRCSILGTLVERFAALTSLPLDIEDRTSHSFTSTLVQVNVAELLAAACSDLVYAAGQLPCGTVLPFCRATCQLLLSHGVQLLTAKIVMLAAAPETAYEFYMHSDSAPGLVLQLLLYCEQQWSGASPQMAAELMPPAQLARWMEAYAHLQHCAQLQGRRGKPADGGTARPAIHTHAPCASLTPPLLMETTCSQDRYPCRGLLTSCYCIICFCQTPVWRSTAAHSRSASL